jgi:hypothetical protein
MSFLYHFPQQAFFGRVLPKNKIYEHASPESRIKELFVREVEKIIWSYKLSPETVNLPAKGGVQEIQVFTVVLKTGTMKSDVLMTIDRAIPSPILFVLTHDGKSRYAAAYKRPSEADKSKWVIRGYLETEWVSDDAGLVELPVVLDMGALYEALLRSLIPIQGRQNENFDALIDRLERYKIKEREAVKLESRMRKEIQFNRRVEINSRLREIRREIELIMDNG